MHFPLIQILHQYRPRIRRDIAWLSPLREQDISILPVQHEIIRAVQTCDLRRGKPRPVHKGQHRIDRQVVCRSFQKSVHILHGNGSCKSFFLFHIFEIGIKPVPVSRVIPGLFFRKFKKGMKLPELLCHGKRAYFPALRPLFHIGIIAVCVPFLRIFGSFSAETAEFHDIRPV